MKGELTLKDVLQWMLENREDFDSMDEINRTSYAYIGRRKDW